MSHPTPSNSTPKNYPATTPEVARLLGLPVEAAKPAAPALGGNAGDGLVRADHAQVTSEGAFGHDALSAHADMSQVLGHDAGAPAAADSGHGDSHGPVLHHAMEIGDENSSAANITKALKTITPYIVIFSVALVVYFYFFGSGINLNLSKVFARQTKAQTPKESMLAQLEKQNMAGYQAWISQFYYDISDPKVIDPEADNSGNGLTNFQKYLLNLNPKSYDTLGLGVADSEALANGMNPLTGGPLTDDQKAVIDKYFDMEIISNRLALAQLQKNGQVAGASTSGFGFGIPSAQAQTMYPAPSDVVGGGSVNIDTNVPGRLQIPSLKIDVPVIWTGDPKNFDVDLRSGVVHYPGTAMPGQIGTAYISGHSSNYVWAKGSYNQIFSKLGDLADNTSFSITVTNKNGKTSVLHYVIAGRQQYDPKDQAQFKNGSKSVVALSTCWPVGTTRSRMVVFGELTQVENQ